MFSDRGDVVLASALAFVGALAFAGCADRGPGGTARVVARPASVASAIPALEAGASVEERFGLQARAPKPDARVAEAARMLRWDVPAGWLESPPSAMRIANFLAAGDPGAECHLTILPGDAGGVGASVNRWLAQMGRPALGPAEIDALPRAALFQRDAVLLEAEGTFAGTSGDPARSDQRLIGLLLVDPDGSAFLKLVGPSDVVARERGAFLALAASFRSAGEDGGPARDGPAGATRVERAGGLVARVPAEWTRVPEEPPRALDLRVGPDAGCSITVLAGEAGGARANIDRWRAQLGLPPLDDTQFAGLERVPLLDGTALLVEASAGESGTLGAVSTAASRSVFVKFTGPVGQIARNRAAFLELCRTLEDG